MNRSLVISLLLFSTCNLSLFVGARALEGDVYSEAGRPRPLGIDEEELLARIIQEEAQGRFDDAPNSPSDDDVEIELEPPANVGEKEMPAEQPSKNDPPATPIKKGQSEFVTFVEPEISQSQRLVDTPEAIKRVPMESSSKQRNGVAASVTEMGNVVFLSVVTICTMAAVVGMVVAGVFWHRLHKQHLAAQEAEYPQYGVIGPSKEKKNKRQNGDESMAYKAQLHHYQQTKQKIISGEETGVTGARHESDESGDEADDGDYSVYECPGLAPTGDIEVQNPMFDSNASAKNDTTTEGD